MKNFYKELSFTAARCKFAKLLGQFFWNPLTIALDCHKLRKLKHEKHKK